MERGECWIFDLDSTLSDANWRKHHLLGEVEDWDGWYTDIDKDPPNHEIIQFTKMARILGITVFICTGRLEKVRKESEQWLFDNGVTYDHLYMRKSDDFREDPVIKKEMLDAIINNGYAPTIAFEDRDSVVKMWRENGLRCFQVDYGDF